MIRQFTLLIALFAIVASPAMAQLDSGLLGHWSFDDGTALDNSGNAHHGIINGNPSLVEGVFGYAFSFDGLDDYINLGNPQGLNPDEAITLTVWYRPESFEGSGNDPVIDKGYSSHAYPFYQYHLGVVGDMYPGSPPEFCYSVAADDVAIGDCVPPYWSPNVWYFLVCTYDGFKIRFYLNGNNVDSADGSGNMQDYGADICIAKYTHLDNYLPGTIDEIRIYDRALSIEEINRHYDPMVGDANFDGSINIVDAVCLVAYIFGEGSPPVPMSAGDADCSGEVNISDVIYLADYIFGGGPSPCDPDGDGVPDC